MVGEYTDVRKPSAGSGSASSTCLCKASAMRSRKIGAVSRASRAVFIRQSAIEFFTVKLQSLRLVKSHLSFDEILQQAPCLRSASKIP